MSNSNVTTSMIRRQRRKLGIVKPKGRRKQFVSISDNQALSTDPTTNN